MKLLKNIKKNKWEIVVLLSSVICLSVSLIVDLFDIILPDIFVLNYSNPLDLFLSLFSVQASVSTLGIAVITIISGVINDYIYGVSVTGFITTIRPLVLKHNRLIIVSLILTAINYFCVSYSLFNCSISIFIVSIIITLYLICKVFVIFLGKRQIKKEIHDYIIENYSHSLLKDLGDELVKAIENGDSVAMQDDFAILREVFQKEVERRNFTKTDITEEIILIASDSLETVSQQHNSKKSNDCLLFISELYSIANQGEIPLYIDLWENNTKAFFRALKDLTYEQLRDNYVHQKMRKNLYENILKQTDENGHGSLLKYYSSWVFSVLFSEDNKLSKHEAQLLQKSIYESVYNSLLLGSMAKSSSEVAKLMLIEVCNLHKCIIDNGYTTVLQEEFFKNSRYRSNYVHHNVILIVTLIYVYYLSCREKLVQGKDIQRNANAIIEENKKIIRNYHHYIDLKAVIKEFYPVIKGILNEWEYMVEGEVKWMIIEYVVTDFMILSAISKYWDEKNISEVIECIAPGSMFEIYNRYFSKDDLSDVKKLFSEFNDIFSNSNDKLTDQRIRILQDVCNIRYKNETLAEGESNQITEEQLDEFANSITEKTEAIIRQNFSDFQFDEQGEDDLTITSKKDVLIYTDVLSEFFFKDDSLDSYIDDNIFESITLAYLRSLLPNLEYKQVKYDYKEKQKQLIDMVKGISINPNIVIGSRDNFFGEENEELLSEYTASMKKIKYPGGYNLYFILDSTLFQISITNIRIKYEDLTWDEITESCKMTDENTVSYNVTNNIFIPFEKSELIKHITNTKKKLLVYADIKYRTKADKIGAGIEITFE